MILIASCEHTNSAVRFVSTTSFHFSTGSSWNGTGGAPIPALLNSTSRRPYFSFTLANNARIASTSFTSVGTISVSPLPSLATASSGSLRRPTSVTANPAFSSASAAARPTPVPAPVTIATFVAILGLPIFHAVPPAAPPGRGNRRQCDAFGERPQWAWSVSRRAAAIAFWRVWTGVSRLSLGHAEWAIQTGGRFRRVALQDAQPAD